MTEATSLTSEELIQRIESSLDNIRPYLEADGGNVKILEVTPDKVVRLEFLGNCSNCSMSTMTFKAGIQEAIKRSVPEIQSIEVVNLTSL